MAKARILIVEDEAIIAMEMESSLRNFGYEVDSISKFFTGIATDSVCG